MIRTTTPCVEIGRNCVVTGQRETIDDAADLVLKPPPFLNDDDARRMRRPRWREKYPFAIFPSGRLYDSSVPLASPFGHGPRTSLTVLNNRQIFTVDYAARLNTTQPPEARGGETRYSDRHLMHLLGDCRGRFRIHLLRPSGAGAVGQCAVAPQPTVHERPMFTDEGLADIVDRLPDDLISIVTMGDDQRGRRDWSYCRRNGLSARR